ncbi:MAG: hypothetical protein HRT93_03260 [Piscirickettsiaceae bacterium]|nr:hypothetical protein [Piscirickettsiaceae bacterium]
MSEMKTYRCTMARHNFTTEPSMEMKVDVIFQSDKEFGEGNPYHDPVGEDLTKACQSGFYKPFFDMPYELAVDGYGGWSSTMPDGRIEEIVDKYDLNLGVPGEGNPRIAETFEYRDSSYRVTSFYKPAKDNDKPVVRRGKVLLAESTREDATHVCGAGIAGCIAAISEIKITGVVSWDARTIVKERAKYEERINASKDENREAYFRGLWVDVGEKK